MWLYSNYHCNLACSYCLTESSPRSSRRELTADTMLAVAGETETLGFTGLGVTGGEPMLLRWLPDTVAALADHLPVVVLTNGTLFGGDRIERARPLARDGIAVQISLDSHLADVNDMARGPTTSSRSSRRCPASWRSA